MYRARPTWSRTRSHGQTRKLQTSFLTSIRFQLRVTKMTQFSDTPTSRTDPFLTDQKQQLLSARVPRQTYPPDPQFPPRTVPLQHMVDQQVRQHHRRVRANRRPNSFQIRQKIFETNPHFPEIQLRSTRAPPIVPHPQPRRRPPSPTSTASSQQSGICPSIGRK